MISLFITCLLNSKKKKKSHFETKVKVLFRKYPRGSFIFNCLAWPLFMKKIDFPQNLIICLINYSSQKLPCSYTNISKIREIWLTKKNRKFMEKVNQANGREGQFYCFCLVSPSRRRWIIKAFTSWNASERLRISKCKRNYRSVNSKRIPCCQVQVPDLWCLQKRLGL